METWSTYVVYITCQPFTPVSQNRVQIAFCLNEILNEARRGELERLHASGRSELQSVGCHTYRFL